MRSDLPLQSSLPILRPLARAGAGKRAAAFVGALLAAGAASAADGQTYKCPGNVYSNTMTAKEAQEKNCKVLEGGSVTVIQSVRPRNAAPATASSPAGSRIDPAEQRARDSDARQILERELKSATDQLAALRAEYNNGEPERRGDERNYAKYQERVADLKAQIARKENDIAAIRREIAKLPAS